MSLSDFTARAEPFACSPRERWRRDRLQPPRRASVLKGTYNTLSTAHIVSRSFVPTGHKGATLLPTIASSPAQTPTPTTTASEAMAPLAPSPSIAPSAKPMSGNIIAALVCASFFGAVVLSASTSWVLQTLRNRRRAADKAKLLFSIPPSSSASSEYKLEEGTGMPIGGSTVIFSADGEVIDNFDGTDVVLTRPSGNNDRATVSAARCADSTIDERGKARSGLTVPLGGYVARNDMKAIRAGCPKTPATYAMEGDRSMSSLCLDGPELDVTEADTADRGANARAAAIVLLKPLGVRN